MPEPADELTIRDPQAARALMNAAFLGEFREPTSPSEVARRTGVKANAAHHHARRLAGLGLLRMVGREGGRVLYQLSAWRFRVPGNVSDTAQLRQSTFPRRVQATVQGLLDACERSAGMPSRPGCDGLRESAFDFGGRAPDEALGGLGRDLGRRDVDEAHPAYYLSRTLHLTPERYRHLLARIEALIVQEESQPPGAGAARCCVGALAFAPPEGDPNHEGMLVTGFMQLPDIGAGEQA